MSESLPTKIAACDSQALMWALPWAMSHEKKNKKTPQDVPTMRQRAKWLLKQLNEQEIELYIPSVVITEILAGVDPKKHARLIAEFDARFFCPSLDPKAAAIAARLWQFERGLQGVGGLPENERSQRIVLKSDMLIIGSAKAAGVGLFYSHDAKCRRLAKEAGMLSFDLPESSGKLFEDPEDEKTENDEGWE